jgi:hypothetical protein
MNMTRVRRTDAHMRALRGLRSRTTNNQVIVTIKYLSTATLHLRNYNWCHYELRYVLQISEWAYNNSSSTY